MGDKVEVEEEINSTMADLEAAWDEVETRGQADPEPEPEGKETESEPEPEVEPEPEPDPKDEPKPGEEPPPPEPTPEEKAPAGWKPDAREHWAKLPPEIKKEVLRRERDFAVGIQYTREAAQRATAFDNVIAPFRPMFAANGQNEFDGIRGVLQVAATLQAGSTQQKVKAVAELINNYGVDLMALDGYLADGSVPKEAQGNDILEQKLKERLAPYENFMRQFQAQQQNQTRTMASTAAQTIQQFSADPKNEFYRDVRMDMADLLDLASKRGVNLTLEDAYNRACMMNPEIAKVINLREQSKRLPGKKKASSSISGSPSAPSATKVPDSLRAEIEAAWEAADAR